MSHVIETKYTIIIIIIIVIIIIININLIKHWYY